MTDTLEPSVVMSTGLPGSDFEMSASSFPETSAEPPSITSAGTSTRADTS